MLQSHNRNAMHHRGAGLRHRTEKGAGMARGGWSKRKPADDPARAEARAPDRETGS
jgi:hypothetical protein